MAPATEETDVHLPNDGSDGAMKVKSNPLKLEPTDRACCRAVHSVLSVLARVTPEVEITEEGMVMDRVRARGPVGDAWGGGLFAALAGGGLLAALAGGGLLTVALGGGLDAALAGGGLLTVDFGGGVEAFGGGVAALGGGLLTVDLGGGVEALGGGLPALGGGLLGGSVGGPVEEKEVGRSSTLR